MRNTERVLANSAVARVLETEKRLGAALTFEGIAAEVVGVYPEVMLEGAADAGAWSCGMVAGLIDDIPSCQELISRIMTQAERLIRDRLTRLADA